MLPHLAPQLYARIAIDVGYAILALTGLSFLGLGAQPPTPELGSIIADARNYTLQAWWYATLPGAFILAAVVSAIVIGNRLERRPEGRRHERRHSRPAVRAVGPAGAVRSPWTAPPFRPPNAR